MDIAQIQHQKQQIVEKYGKWTAHNIQLEGDLYTIKNQILGDEIKLRRVVQIVSDMAEKPLNNLRILDLACLEGLYAVEFARRGAEVVAIEGREVNIEKARFTKNILSLSNLELFQDDVRNLSVEQYGSFDVVLCLGVLYHLDFQDVYSFLEKIHKVCRGFTVIDTHLSLTPEISYNHKGKNYWGKTFIEHEPESTAEARKKSLWASLDNLSSFWPTRSSLYNVLAHVGFTSAYECYVPEEAEKPVDRITIVAVHGHRQKLINCPLMNTESAKDLPESSLRHAGRLFSRRARKIAKCIPRPVKAFLKKLMPS